MTEVGTIENGVAIGHERTLFLAGGSHEPVAFATGERVPSPASFGVFRRNLAERAEWAARNGAAYVHVIFPDKQSYAPELWPFGTPRRLGDMYLSACEPAERAKIMYPVPLLLANRALVTSRIDTHLTMAGCAMVAAELVRRITGHDQSARLRDILSDLTEPKEVSGDLGSKLDPPWTDTLYVSGTLPPGRFISNQIAGGNNGMVDIRIARRAAFGLRVLIFGESFARQASTYLPWFFSEILFCRTAFFHPEIAEAYRPDVLITSNAERYLSNPPPDESRPSFLTYPWLNGGTHSPSKEFARALSAMLSFPRAPYREFIADIRT